MNEKQIELTLKGVITCDDNQDEINQFVQALKSGELKAHQVCQLKLLSIEVKDTEDED
jgi:hypothetical protein